MKILCQKAHLLESIQIVQKAVSTKSTIPMIGGIYLSAKEGVLELQSNDYETAIKCSLPVQILTSGTTVLAAKYFSEIVRKLPGDTIEISSSSENTMITLKSGKACYNLVCLPHADFPVVQILESNNTYEIPEKTFKNIIRQTTFACAHEDTRPVFTGVLCEIENTKINMIATNTHRLSFRTAEIINNTNCPLKVIIPSKILNELNKILSSEMETNVSISCHQNKMAFNFRGIYMETQLIEGQFPNYNQVIPKNFKTEIIIETNALSEAVERASLLTRDGDYNVIKMDVDNEKITVTSNNPEVGVGYEEAGAITTGEPITIAFNARYILDVLKIIDTPEILFSFTSPLTPATIKSKEQNEYMYVITPVRTN